MEKRPLYVDIGIIVYFFHGLKKGLITFFFHFKRDTKNVTFIINWLMILSTFFIIINSEIFKLPCYGWQHHLTLVIHKRIFLYFVKRFNKNYWLLPLGYHAPLQQQHHHHPRWHYFEWRQHWCNLLITLLVNLMLIDHRLRCWDIGVEINVLSSGLNSRTSASNSVSSYSTFIQSWLLLTTLHFRKQFFCCLWYFLPCFLCPLNDHQYVYILI